MAASPNLPELGGYDYEFTGKVPDNCECLVCHLPMKDPVQIDVMWTQTLQHLYGITLAVMPNVTLHVVISPAFYAVQQLYLEHKI